MANHLIITDASLKERRHARGNCGGREGVLGWSWWVEGQASVAMPSPRQVLALREEASSSHCETHCGDVHLCGNPGTIFLRATAAACTAIAGATFDRNADSLPANHCAAKLLARSWRCVAKTFRRACSEILSPLRCPDDSAHGIKGPRDAHRVPASFLLSSSLVNHRRLSSVVGPVLLRRDSVGLILHSSCGAVIARIRPRHTLEHRCPGKQVPIHSAIFPTISTCPAKLRKGKANHRLPYLSAWEKRKSAVIIASGIS